MPWAVRPRPMRAAAVMMAPLSARMGVSSRDRGRYAPIRLVLLAEHTQTTAEDEQNARQNDEDAATTAARPRTMRPLGIEEAAAAKHRTATHAHNKSP